MEFLSNDKLLIVGAAGMIGSNMVPDCHNDGTHTQHLSLRSVLARTDGRG